MASRSIQSESMTSTTAKRFAVTRSCSAQMLTPEQGHSYYPLTLGRRLKDGQLEVVRKLGWAEYSSVWLARPLE